MSQLMTTILSFPSQLLRSGASFANRLLNPLNETPADLTGARFIAIDPSRQDCRRQVPVATRRLLCGDQVVGRDFLRNRPLIDDARLAALGVDDQVPALVLMVQVL